MTESSIIERILLIKKELGYETDGAFADAANISRPNFSQMLNGNRTIGESIINKICVQMNINKEWLLTGNGNMLNPTAADIPVPVPANVANVQYVPLVSQYAYAGYLCGYSDADYIDALPLVPVLVDHELKGRYMMFEVKGESMNNGTEESILEGDRLLGREIKRELWKYKLHINKWDFIVVHRTEGILVKRITEHDTEQGTITLHSLNSEYDDRVLSLNDVAQIFNVIEVHRNRRR
ncbi:MULTISPECIES: XRE family transcriptional regulator [unclassified Dysgonomonas]|uniref:XRE family transcriptional regulator n=1 Tax=unclassified Dysgonomonas TaxID=2630389 RepID=UPI002476CC03|nr:MULTISPECIES: S24 family peptidase [unclassified Dysgonomonas]